MARPKIKIDAEQVVKLAQLMCNNTEIAAFFDCSTDTIVDRFSKELIKGRELGKMSLRRAQMKTALGGNATMQIWLGKQYLGQSDKIEVAQEELINEELEFTDMPKGTVNGRFKRFYN